MSMHRRKTPAAVPSGKSGRTDGPADEFLMSEEFGRVATQCFNEATRKAINEHHAEGRPVHGIVDGRIVQIKPPGANKADT